MKDLERPSGRTKSATIIAPPATPGSEWREIRIAPDAGRAAQDKPVAPRALPERRVDTRGEHPIAARFTTIDPVRDAASGALFFDTSDEETVVNASRRGLCLNCERAPVVGTRLLLELRLPGETKRADIVGRVCWTSVVFTPGVHGARATAKVGIELLGGSPSALDIYDRSLGRLLQTSQSTVASREAVG